MKTILHTPQTGNDDCRRSLEKKSEKTALQELESSKKKCLCFICGVGFVFEIGPHYAAGLGSMLLTQLKLQHPYLIGSIFSWDLSGQTLLEENTAFLCVTS